MKNSSEISFYILSALNCTVLPRGLIGFISHLSSDTTGGNLTEQTLFILDSFISSKLFFLEVQ